MLCHPRGCVYFCIRSSFTYCRGCVVKKRANRAVRRGSPLCSSFFSRLSTMAREILFEDNARRRVMRGVKKLSDAVITTLGPRGRNVVLEKSWGAPQVTKDGVTVAKAIDLADQFENLGAQMIKQAASETNDSAGDGKIGRASCRERG